MKIRKWGHSEGAFGACGERVGVCSSCVGVPAAEGFSFEVLPEKRAAVGAT